MPKRQIQGRKGKQLYLNQLFLGGMKYNSSEMREGNARLIANYDITPMGDSAVPRRPIIISNNEYSLSKYTYPFSFAQENRMSFLIEFNPNFLVDESDFVRDTIKPAPEGTPIRIFSRSNNAINENKENITLTPKVTPNPTVITESGITDLIDSKYSDIYNEVKFLHGTSTPLPLESDLRIIDGDTFENGGVRYRIWGIDAPELNTPWALFAKQLLSYVLHETGQEVVILRNFGVDVTESQRTVIDLGIKTGGYVISFSELIVRFGLAKVQFIYQEYAVRLNRLFVFQQSAQTDGLYMWSENPDPSFAYTINNVDLSLVEGDILQILRIVESRNISPKLNNTLDKVQTVYVDYKDAVAFIGRIINNGVIKYKGLMYLKLKKDINYTNFKMEYPDNNFEGFVPDIIKSQEVGYNLLNTNMINLQDTTQSGAGAGIRGLLVTDNERDSVIDTGVVGQDVLLNAVLNLGYLPERTKPFYKLEAELVVEQKRLKELKTIKPFVTLSIIPPADTQNDLHAIMLSINGTSVFFTQSEGTYYIPDGMTISTCKVSLVDPNNIGAIGGFLFSSGKEGYLMGPNEVNLTSGEITSWTNSARTDGDYEIMSTKVQTINNISTNTVFDISIEKTHYVSRIEIFFSKLFVTFTNNNIDYRKDISHTITGNRRLIIEEPVTLVTLNGGTGFDTSLGIMEDTNKLRELEFITSFGKIKFDFKELNISTFSTLIRARTPHSTLPSGVYSSDVTARVGVYSYLYSKVTVPEIPITFTEKIYAVWDRAIPQTNEWMNIIRKDVFQTTNNVLELKSGANQNHAWKIDVFNNTSLRFQIEFEHTAFLGQVNLGAYVNPFQSIPLVMPLFKIGVVPKFISNEAIKNNIEIKNATRIGIYNRHMFLYGAYTQSYFIQFSMFEEPWYFPFPFYTIEFPEEVIHVQPYLGHLVVFGKDNIYMLKSEGSIAQMSLHKIYENLSINKADIHLVNSVATNLLFFNNNIGYIIVPNLYSDDPTNVKIYKLTDDINNALFQPENLFKTLRTDIAINTNVETIFATYTTYVEGNFICVIANYQIGNKYLSVIYRYNQMFKNWVIHFYTIFDKILVDYGCEPNIGRQFVVEKDGKAYLAFTDPSPISYFDKFGDVEVNIETVLDSGYLSVDTLNDKRFKDIIFEFDNITYDNELEVYLNFLIDGAPTYVSEFANILSDGEPIDVTTETELNDTEKSLTFKHIRLSEQDKKTFGNLFRVGTKVYSMPGRSHLRIPIYGKGRLPSFLLRIKAPKLYEFINYSLIYKEKNINRRR